MRFIGLLFLFNFLVSFLSCTKQEKGSNQKDGSNSSELIKAPEENRFTKMVLVEGLGEPMELAVAPNGNVFWIERYGNINYYDLANNQATTIGKLNVFSGNNDGLLGIALDPDFTSNHFIYLFYSPAGTIPKQHVSRFVIQNNKLDISSEKVVLEIPTQRELCCHSAGSLEFGPDGNLYIAVGDNTNPWEQEGYSPLDERPDKAYWDAQRTSANTNDLRGKILRIHPEPDGSYTIPDGNLFPKDDSQGKPEIYVMGARNPFRITVDQKTSYLYFGDIGPDANTGSERGPAAYDEINVAKKPGNYGWPYFVADNKAYPKLDFATNSIGPYFKADSLINNSPNNTGQKKLPPAQKAMIFYSAEEPKEFPGMGKGGRSALAGQVYHFNPNLQSEVKFPEYYDNTLFIMEWMRDWIKVVKLDEKGDYAAIEPFMPSAEFSSPVDMQFAPDGSLYVLEYGSGWYSNNKDAKLSRITYNKGNRPPIAKADASVKAGKAPLTVQFSSTGTTDYDGDKLSYQWQFDTTGTGKASSIEPNPTFTFSKSGVYNCQLTVTDTKGEKSHARVEVIVGNTPPQVAIEVSGNQMFFWDKAPVHYQVQVTDQEDGSLADGGINPSEVFVFLDYSANNDNLSPMLVGHQQVMNHPGKQLIDGSDCKSCHLQDKNSIGPSYVDVAKRYKNDPHAVDRLADKIIQGGGGVWKRDFVMISHPQLSKKAATEMVNYILSLADEQKKAERIGVKGDLQLNVPSNKTSSGVYKITASYQDKGGENVKALTQSASLVLKSPKIQAESYDVVSRVKVFGEVEDGDSRYLGNIQNNSNVVYKGIDLTGVGAITYNFSTTIPGVSIEVHLDSLKGEVVSVAEVSPAKDLSSWKKISAPIKETQGIHDLYLVIKCKNTSVKNFLQLDWLFLERKQRTNI